MWTAAIEVETSQFWTAFDDANDKSMVRNLDLNKRGKQFPPILNKGGKLYFP